MNMNALCEGIWIPASTPFETDGRVSSALFLQHCRTLLAQGAHGLAMLGTTSEANSLSLHERSELLQFLVANGVRPSQLLPGTGAAALPDAVQFTKTVVAAGCAGALVLPPFFYKSPAVNDDGLFAFYSELIERVGSTDLRVYLYHIPQMTGLGISLGLIERLLKAYPGVIAGLKDSSGNWANTLSVIQAFPMLRVFSASEALMLNNLRAGGAGCITATGNSNLVALRQLYDHWQQADADALQVGVARRRQIVEAFPMISAVKSVLAHQYQDRRWAQVRAPLVAMTPAQEQALIAQLEADGAFAAQPLAAA